MAHDARHGVAESCPTTMTDMHGARRVRGDVLEVHLALSFGNRALAKVEPSCAHIRNDALERLGRQAEVDETGAGNLDQCYEVVARQVVDYSLRNLARCLVSSLGSTHGHRGCPIAIGFVARTLERRIGQLFELESPCSHGCGYGLVDHRFQLLANLHDGAFPICAKALRSARTPRPTTWRT